MTVQSGSGESLCKLPPMITALILYKELDSGGGGSERLSLWYGYQKLAAEITNTVLMLHSLMFNLKVEMSSEPVIQERLLYVASSTQL